MATATVVVTRPRGKAGALVRPFEAAGLRVLVLPAIEIVPPEDPARLRAVVRRLDDYHWVVLTSPRGVGALADALEQEELSPGRVRPERVAVVGPSTAEAVEEIGWSVDVMPTRYTADGLLEALLEEETVAAGTRILLPLAEAARDVLENGLADAGASVERVVAYRSVRPEEAEVERVRAALENGTVDLLTFTSPSTARNFLELVGRASLMVPAAAIGPVTARSARNLGYRVVAVADEHTPEGLVRAVLDRLSESGG